MNFNDLILLAESADSFDDEQFVEAVVKWLSDHTDFDETAYPHFRTVGNMFYTRCEEDLIDNKGDSGYNDDDDNEIEVGYSEVIDHISYILTRYTDFDPHNSPAFENWAFGDKRRAEKVWRDRIKKRNALTDGEHGMDLTF